MQTLALLTLVASLLITETPTPIYPTNTPSPTPGTPTPSTATPTPYGLMLTISAMDKTHVAPPTVLAAQTPQPAPHFIYLPIATR